VSLHTKAKAGSITLKISTFIMDPKGPSQPSQQTGYNQPNNPSTQTTSEQTQSHDPSTSSAPPIDHRQPHDIPSTHTTDATSSSLGRGDTGPLKQKDTSASDAQNYSRSELDGEQMRAPGEGDVADAVTEKKFGGHGEEEGLMENIEQKTQAHKEALHERGERTGAEIEEEGKEDWTGKKGEVDLGEALGGRGKAVVLAADE
jgi:hypothetical protein